MRFYLTIACDNAAFEDPQEEIPRILGVVAGKITNGAVRGRIHDANGNDVGYFQEDHE